MRTVLRPHLFTAPQPRRKYRYGSGPRPPYKDSPDAPYYLELLRTAWINPANNSVPVCQLHIEEMAQSISKSEQSEMVLVVVKPGLKELELFNCFLCYRDGT